MGYEAKIYAGYLSNSVETDGTRYMHVVGMVDLSAVNLPPAKEGIPTFFYYEQSGSDAPTVEDCYGNKLIAIPVGEMLTRVKNTMKSFPKYRRWKVAIALLENLQDFPEDEIYCVVFGY